MARYEVVIETRPSESWFRAEVAQGPEFVRKVASPGFAATARAAYGEVALRLRRHFSGKHTFDFLHVES